MAIGVRLLGPGDEPVLRLLSEQEEAFDLEGRGGPSTPPEPADAAAYLADPAVLHWVAELDGEVVGCGCSPTTRGRSSSTPRADSCGTTNRACRCS